MSDNMWTIRSHFGPSYLQVSMDPLYREFARLGEELQPFIDGPVRLTEPFFGLGGVAGLLSAVGVKVQLVNTFDLDDNIADWHRALVRNGIRDTCGPVWSGPLVGDMMSVPVKSLLDSDILAAGPPCQGFSASGLKGREEDSRSDCYSRVVDWVVELARRGCLKGYFIENGTGIMDNNGSDQSFAEKMLSTISSQLPFFKHGYAQVTPSGVVPVRRVRMWLRGVRFDCLKHDDAFVSLPSPLHCFSIPAIKLEDLLDKTLAPAVVSDMPRNLAKNLTLYMQKMRLEIAWGHPGRVAVFELDRHPDTDGYSGKLTYDLVPPLRCKGPPYFVCSTWDLHLPQEQMTFFRMISVSERFLLVGYRKEHASFMCNQTAMLKATGNAYPLAMSGQVVLPVLQVMCNSGVMHGDRHNLSEAELQDLVCASVQSVSPLGTKRAEPHGSACMPPLDGVSRRRHR